MWKLKLDADGKAVIQDGKAVWIAPDGKEVAFDVGGAMDSMATLRTEAKGHREAKEAAEATVKKFTDAGLTVEKAADAAKALQTVANIDSKTLVDAGKVEEIRAAAVKATEEKFAPIVAERDKYKTSLVNEKIGGAFARSPLIVGDKATLAIPADLVQARFGSHFAIDDASGNVVAKDHAGNPIYSKANPGVLAGFDEALGIIVESYPQRDMILKGTGGSGSGKTPSNNGNPSGAKQVTRSEFDAMPHPQRMTFSKEGGKVVD
jgi:hypothetical protein